MTFHTAVQILDRYAIELLMTGELEVDTKEEVVVSPDQNRDDVDLSFNFLSSVNMNDEKATT